MDVGSVGREDTDAAILNPMDDNSYEIHEVGPGTYVF